MEGGNKRRRRRRRRRRKGGGGLDEQNLISSLTPELFALVEPPVRRLGFRYLRKEQEQVLTSALGGRDTLVVLPTGFGKSACYQIPSMILEKPVVVVSPLLALLKDQEEKLASRDIPVVRLDGTVKGKKQKEALARVAQGKVLVLTTPETLSGSALFDTLKECGIGLVAVDEAHCVSEWGHDFRPSYVRLGARLAELGSPPVLALTATATQRVREDIVRALALREPTFVGGSPHRQNLQMSSMELRGDERALALIKLIKKLPRPGIIYCSTTRAVDQVYVLLKRLGHPVHRYHGKMTQKDRIAEQDEFMKSGRQIMVATSAFGMGIDKADIRFIVHYHAPASLEQYVQEAGRAGRDGKSAQCIMLYDPTDRQIHEALLEDSRIKPPQLYRLAKALANWAKDDPETTIEALALSAGMPKRTVEALLSALEQQALVRVATKGNVEILAPAETIEQQARDLAGRFETLRVQDGRRLDAMDQYAEIEACRAGFIRQYFGEPAGANCGQCDICRGVKPLSEAELAEGVPVKKKKKKEKKGKRGRERQQGRGDGRGRDRKGRRGRKARGGGVDGRPPQRRLDPKAFEVVMIQGPDGRMVAHIGGAPEADDNFHLEEGETFTVEAKAAPKVYGARPPGEKPKGERPRPEGMSQRQQHQGGGQPRPPHQGGGQQRPHHQGGGQQRPHQQGGGQQRPHQQGGGQQPRPEGGQPFAGQPGVAGEQQLGEGSGKRRRRRRRRRRRGGGDGAQNAQQQNGQQPAHGPDGQPLAATAAAPDGQQQARPPQQQRHQNPQQPNRQEGQRHQGQRPQHGQQQGQRHGQGRHQQGQRHGGDGRRDGRGAPYVHWREREWEAAAEALSGRSAGEEGARGEREPPRGEHAPAPVERRQGYVERDPPRGEQAPASVARRQEYGEREPPRGGNAPAPVERPQGSVEREPPRGEQGPASVARRQEYVEREPPRGEQAPASVARRQGSVEREPPRPERASVAESARSEREPTAQVARPERESVRAERETAREAVRPTPAAEAPRPATRQEGEAPRASRAEALAAPAPVAAKPRRKKAETTEAAPAAEKKPRRAAATEADAKPTRKTKAASTAEKPMKKVAAKKVAAEPKAKKEATSTVKKTASKKKTAKKKVAAE